MLALLFNPSTLATLHFSKDLVLFSAPAGPLPSTASSGAMENPAGDARCCKPQLHQSAFGGLSLAKHAWFGVMQGPFFLHKSSGIT